jgi:peptidoglycan hydrolase CwlO-like protein
MNSIELNERWVKALQLIGEHIKANNDLKKEIAELKEEIYRLNNMIINQNNTLCKK